MLAPNIETEVREILEKKAKAGWLRVSQCAKLYANGNPSKETKFYRWRKKVEKGKVKGFQVIVFPGNISFIGLETADPSLIETLMSKDKRERPLYFKEIFLSHCFKRLEYLSTLSLRKPADALILLGNLIAMLPSPKREKVESTYKSAQRVTAKIQKEGMSLSISPFEMKNQIRVIVRHLIGEVSKVLHES